MTILRGCLRVTAPLAILLVALEVLLSLYDPMGYSFFMDYQELITHYDAAHGGFAPGTYDYPSWHVTINRDYTRAVPGTPDRADCTLIALGDSVTFGYGVDDDETFLRFLARAFPGVRFVNTGIPGANSTRVADTYERIEGDGYLYLMLENDTLRDTLAIENRAQTPPVHWTRVSLYAVNIYRLLKGTNPSMTGEEPSQAEIDSLLKDIEPLAADPRVLIFTYGDLAFMADVPHVPIAVPETTISPGDAHPDRAGHKQMADTMRPYVNDLIDRVCK